MNRFFDRLDTLTFLLPLAYCAGRGRSVFGINDKDGAAQSRQYLRCDRAVRVLVEDEGGEARSVGRARL